MVKEHFNVYCETTKTCPWKRLRVQDKEDAIALGQQHAEDEHPQMPRWRVRVKTIRETGAERMVEWAQEKKDSSAKRA